MASHTLVLTFWPVLTNKLLRTHWAKRSRMLRRDAEALTLDAISQGIPMAKGKRRVSLTVLYSNESHRPDPDALLKATLDCLAGSGRLLDDNPDACELGGVAYERAPRKGLVITLEDL